MKTRNYSLILRYMLMAGLGVLSAGRVTAQTFTNLYSFMAASYDSLSETETNSGGAYPSAGLILSGNMLYGTTSSGGTNGNGTVFAVHTDGTGFTTLHSFTALSALSYQGGTNNDGASPAAGLVLSGNTLYGTAEYGGTNGNGTVFALNTNGTGFTTLHTFTAYISYTNSDGINPGGRLISSGSTLYGTAGGGGATGSGTVFALNINGTGFTNLYSFTAFPSVADGANPFAGLVLSGNTLYGTTHSGGGNGGGTVFAVTTYGTGFTNLHNFTGYSDGDNPYAGLVLLGNTLFGTAGNGGAGYGTLFAVNTNGGDFATLHTFTYTPDGGSPRADLIISGSTLYGTAGAGGTNGSGMVFSLTLPTPPLTITISGANDILTWPTNNIMFTLQSTTSLAPPIIWNDVFPLPVVVNGQDTVTNPISITQPQFYRLSL